MRTDKDFENFGKEVWEKSKEYILDECHGIDIDDIMQIAVKNNLCLYELYNIEKHGEYNLEEEGEDYIYWWGE